jgi:hypothetical protein
MSDKAKTVMRLASSRDATDLTRLIATTYRLNDDFQVHNESYYTDHFGASRAVMVAEADGELVATMRADYVANTSDLLQEDEGHARIQDMPGILLCRAATVSDRRFRALNSAMRVYALEAALAAGVNSLLGFVHEDAPRTRLMRQIGYHFFPLAATGNPHLSYKSKCFFCRLDLKKDGNEALGYLRHGAAEALDVFRWSGGALADYFRPDESSSALPAAC